VQRLAGRGQGQKPATPKHPAHSAIAQRTRVSHTDKFMTFKFTQKAQFFRFVLVGILNSAVGYGLFALFIYLGLHYALANLVATILAVCFNFFSTGKLVFKQTGGGGTATAVRFVLVYALLYGVNVLLLSVLLKTGLTEYLAGLLLIPVIAVLAYILHSQFTFRSPKPVAPALGNPAT
jgi:putative flippase GtrA